MIGVCFSWRMCLKAKPGSRNEYRRCSTKKVALAFFNSFGCDFPFYRGCQNVRGWIDCRFKAEVFGFLYELSFQQANDPT